MLTFYLYAICKAIHIASLVCWLGPTLGSWWALKRAEKESATVKQNVYATFLQTLWVEHIALVTLLGSGAVMASLSNAWFASWLMLKLAIITAVILPLEIIDIYIGNFYLPKRANIRNPTRLEKFYHGPFTRVAMIVLPPAVVVIFLVATTKWVF